MILNKIDKDMADNYISRYTGAQIDSRLDQVTTNKTNIDTKVNKTTTINGHELSGNITLNKGDVGLGNVDNTSDANKPISTAAQTALNAKADKTSVGTLTDLTTTSKTNLVSAVNEVNERADTISEDYEMLLNALRREIAALERYGTDMVGYVRVSGKTDPVFTQNYNTTQPTNVTSENVMDIFKPCLVDSGGHITKVLNAVTLQDEDGNDAVIDGSQGNLLICNVRGYYHISGHVTVDDVTYDVFLRKLTAFSFGGRQAEYQPPFGMSPNYCVAHKDSDNVTRMYSAYDSTWSGNHYAPSYKKYAVGRYNFSGEDTTYDADDYMVRAQGAPTESLKLYTGEQYAQNHNSDTSKTYPYCNMTARAVELFVGNMVAEMGTWAGHKSELMGSGFSSNVAPTSASFTDATDVKACNGFTVDGQYKTFGSQLMADTKKIYPVCCLNEWATPWGCLEQQRILAYCAKNNIAPNTFFTLNGNKYRYRNITGMRGLSDGVMTAVIYKYMSSQLADNVTWADGKAITNKRIDYIVSSAVYRGRITDVSPSWWISGLLDVIDGGDNNSQTWWMQRDQKKLITCKNWANIPNTQDFDFEESYTKVIKNPKKEGYALDFCDDALMVTKTFGASLYGGIGHYLYSSSTTTDGQKSVRGFREGNVFSEEEEAEMFRNEYKIDY